MFDRRKSPDKPFSHAYDCKIVKVDPRVEIQWSEIRRGVYEAVCVCGTQYHYEQIADSRIRLDPYDPSTSHHMPQCEHRDTTDPALLRAILRVRDGAGGGYWVAECGVCETFWQVPFYAVESAG